MTVKQFYSTYLADDSISDLSKEVINEILKYEPVHAFEYGCGTGKHLRFLQEVGVEAGGIDISTVNIAKAIFGHGLKNVLQGDETHLRHIANYDCVFTVSVLDHIEDVEEIIGELKRIANKSVILAETNSLNGNYYYKHNYEKFGFEKVPHFKWFGEDDAIYYIYKWEK